MRALYEGLRKLRRSSVFLHSVAVIMPLGIVVLGVQVALPAFVFEHLMVLLVVGLAVAGGRLPAVVAAVVGSIGDNLLLRDPVGRPAITGMRDVVDFGLFLIVAIVVGWLVDGLRVAKARAVEAAERERRAREERDRLVATFTHDLATPLGAIQGTIQFVRKHADASKLDVGRLLVRVETAAARAASLVRALADTKSIEQHSLALERRRLDFRAVVEPVVRMLDHASDRHPIELALDAAPLLVYGDPQRLGGVVENLISNAIKYSPNGGAIEVHVGRDNGSVVMSVRDHGIGMSDEAREHLFELGYRAPQAAGVAPGLGLGLYTALEVVRLHGGTITSVPARSEGTIFTVHLPLATGDRNGSEPGGAPTSDPESQRPVGAVPARREAITSER